MLRAPCCQGIAARFTVDARMAHDNEQAAAALSFNGLTRRYFAENKPFRNVTDRMDLIGPMMSS